MNDTFYLHCITTVCTLGSTQIAELYSSLGSFREIFYASKNELLRHRVTKTQMHNLISSRTEISLEKEQQLLDNHGISLCAFTDKHYPALLKEIPDFPPLLYYFGTLPASSNKLLSVVGTRKHTSYGKRVAENFLPLLAQNGIAIVSGLALGIDTLAHTASVNNKSQTYAIIGSGLLHLSPQSNTKLAQRILHYGGAIISEFPPRFEARPAFFPQRNRIIAGLSKATLVIEAPKKSGALITADLALDYNRDVFSIPGNVFSDVSNGTHHLIKNGAKLISDPKDILEEYTIVPKKKTQKEFTYTPQNNNEKHILDALQKHGELLIDDLAHHTTLGMADVHKTLSILEIQGIIEKTSIGYISLK